MHRVIESYVQNIHWYLDLIKIFFWNHVHRPLQRFSSWKFEFGAKFSFLELEFPFEDGAKSFWPFDVDSFDLALVFCSEDFRDRGWCWCCDWEGAIRRKVSRLFLDCCAASEIGSFDKIMTIVGICRVTFRDSRSGDFGSQNSATFR